MQLNKEEQEHLLTVLLEHVVVTEESLRLIKGRSDKERVRQHLTNMLEKDNALLRKVRSSLINRT